MDLSKAATLGRIEKIINGKPELTDFILKKSGQFFYLVDIIAVRRDYEGELDEGIQLAFHEYEVVEQLEGLGLAGLDTIYEFPGETFLRFLSTLIAYYYELNDSQLPRNRQLIKILNELLLNEGGESEIELILRSLEPQLFVQAQVTTA